MRRSGKRVRKKSCFGKPKRDFKRRISLCQTPTSRSNTEAWRAGYGDLLRHMMPSGGIQYPFNCRASNHCVCAIFRYLKSGVWFWCAEGISETEIYAKAPEYGMFGGRIGTPTAKNREDPRAVPSTGANLLSEGCCCEAQRTFRFAFRIVRRFRLLSCTSGVSFCPRHSTVLPVFLAELIGLSALSRALGNLVGLFRGTCRVFLRPSPFGSRFQGGLLRYFSSDVNYCSRRRWWRCPPWSHRRW